MIKGATMVLMLEMVTDKALSPFARKVMTLDDVPVGQQPRRTKPTRSIGERLRKVPMPRPTRGMKIYKVTTPMMTSFGREKMSLKSLGDMERPMLSMIMPKK